MRILWLTSQRPAPDGSAGALHELELLRFTAKNHDVLLLSSALSPGERSDVLDNIGVDYEGVDWTPTRPLFTSPRLLWRLHLLWRVGVRGAGTGFWFQGDRVDALKRALDRIQANERFDLTQVVSGEIAPLLASTRAPSALLLFDAYVRGVQAELRRAPRLRDRAIWRANLRKVRRWEKRWYGKADTIACVSELDARTLSTMLSRPVGVIPNPIGDGFFERPDRTRSRGLVTMVASLHYRPNVDAVGWLIEDVWPHVRRLCPEAQLRIVGKGPLPEVRALSDQVGASLFADVDDVRPFYWDTAVAVAPIRLGSGVRNKVLHAMATRAPLVATSAAVEGLDVEHGRHLLVADSDQDFAQAIVRTLNDPGDAERRTARAYALALKFRADVVGPQLEAWWDQTLGGRLPNASAS